MWQIKTSQGIKRTFETRDEAITELDLLCGGDCIVEDGGNIISYYADKSSVDEAANNQDRLLVLGWATDLSHYGWY